MISVAVSGGVGVCSRLMVRQMLGLLIRVRMRYILVIREVFKYFYLGQWAYTYICCYVYFRGHDDRLGR